MLSLQITLWIFLWEAGTAIAVNQYRLLDATQSQMVTLGLIDHTSSVHQAEKVGQAEQLIEEQGALLQQQ